MSNWEQHKASFASAKLAKDKAGGTFAKNFPGAIPWNFRLDGTGTWISVLRLEDLWRELLDAEAQIEDELARVAEEAGLPAIPRLADSSRPFPRRKSKVLGFAMVAQDLHFEFD